MLGWRLRAESALSLAVLRIVVALLMLAVPGFREGARIAVRARESWIAPEGLGWFVRYVPINGVGATTAQMVVAFAALCAAVGYKARLFFGVLAVAGFYLFSIGQLAGHVWHDMHLLWFCAVLAVSPCADVLAVDKQCGLGMERQGPQYALPLWIVRLLLGAIYFFPGVHKLVTSGFGWALSDNLRYQLYWKWAQHGSIPDFRIDQFPGLLRAGGVAVLAFELSFVFLVLFRRTRWVAAVSGLAFHLVSQAVFKIPFASLWLCYVALLDLRPVYRALRACCGRLHLGSRATATPSLSPSPSGGTTSDPLPVIPAVAPAIVPVIVGLFLIVATVIQGVRGQTRSYPFAAYPTFDRTPAVDMPDLMIVETERLLGPVELVHARSVSGYRTQRQWAEIWSLAGVTAPFDRRRLEIYYATWRGRRAAGHAKRHVVFYRVYRSVVPEERGRLTRPPLALLEIDE